MIGLAEEGRPGTTQLFVMQINNNMYRNHSVFRKALESASVAKKLAGFDIQSRDSS